MENEGPVCLYVIYLCQPAMWLSIYLVNPYFHCPKSAFDSDSKAKHVINHLQILNRFPCYPKRHLKNKVFIIYYMFSSVFSFYCFCVQYRQVLSMNDVVESARVMAKRKVSSFTTCTSRSLLPRVDPYPPTHLELISEMYYIFGNP